MAYLRPGRMGRKRLSLKPAVMFRVSQGRTYAQAWPRKRGLPALSYQRANLKRMSIAQQMAARLPANERATMEQGLTEFLKTHTGVKGTAAIRLRDWITQIFFGRAWAIQEADGTVHYSAAVYRDCSDFLDWLEPMTGSLVTRTQDGWLPTFQCSPGLVFTCTDDWRWQGACRNAQVPPAHLALGGTLEEGATPTALEPIDTVQLTEGQELPQDLFDRDPFPDYRRDGDLDTWWMIRNGYMTAIFGSNGHLIRKNTSIQDGLIEFDTDQAESVGAVFRYQDSGNHYLLAVSDESGIHSADNVILWRIQGGSGTRLIEHSMTWPRGEPHTFRVDFVGDGFTLYVDGVQEAQVTDATFSAAGEVGLRNFKGGGINRLSRFKWGSAT